MFLGYLKYDEQLVSLLTSDIEVAHSNGTERVLISKQDQYLIINTMRNDSRYEPDWKNIEIKLLTENNEDTGLMLNSSIMIQNRIKEKPKPITLERILYQRK